MREDLVARNVVNDKDEPAAMVLIGPVVEPFRRKHRVLGGLHDSRLLEPVGKRNNTLDAQQVGAARAGEAPQSASEVESRDGSFEDHTERIDAVGVRGGTR